MNKLRAAILLVSFWIMTAGLALAQVTYTDNLHLALPPAAANTWGADYNNNFTILDSAVSSGGVTDTTCQAGQKVSSIVAGVPTCTPTTLLNESLYLVGVLSPPQIVANTNDYAPANLGTASTLYINTDASRNLTGITGGATGRVLILYNNGTQNIVLVNESGLSSAINRLAINANITLGPAQGIIIQYDGVATRWRAASGVSGAGGQAADNDLTALAALSSTGFAARTTTDTWAQRVMTGTTNNISITNGDGILGNPTFDVGPNVALTTRSFTAQAGSNVDFNLLNARSFTMPGATGAAPTTPATIAFDITSQNYRAGLTNGSTVTFATTAYAQPLNANLTALSSQTGAANRFSYWTAAATLGLGILPAAPCNAGEALTFNSVSPYTMICTPTTGISGGVLNTFALFSSATAITASGSLLSQSGGNVLVNGGLILGNCGTDCINHVTSAYTGHGAISLTWPYVGGAAAIVLSTGTLTAGHSLVVGANGQITDSGGTAGTGDQTASNVAVFSNKTAIDALAGGGAGNVIKSQLVTTFDGGALTPSGGCTNPAAAEQINSGPWTYTLKCPTATTAQFTAMVPQLKQAISTIFVRLHVNDTVSSSHVYAGTFKAMCRGSTDTVNNTWGSTQAVSITMVTASITYEGVTAAITPNGTCSAHKDLWVQFDANAGTMTDTGTARVVSVSIEQQS